MRRVEQKSLRARVDAGVATRLDTRVVDRLVAAGGRTRRFARWTSYLLATAVYAVVLAFLVVGVALLVGGDNWVQRVLGVLAVLPVVVLVLPARSHDTTVEVTPERAPHLTALVHELCTALGTRPPTYIGIDEAINASAGGRGLRERQLVLGAPLWAALGPQARVALLAHELGHFSNRDVVHGRYVWTAELVLATWHHLLTPDGLVSTEGKLPVYATIVTAPLRLPLVGYMAVMWKAQAAASRHDELHADTAASTVAGTPGAVEMLECLLLTDLIDIAANRAAVDPRRPDLGTEIRTRIEGVDRAARRALPDAAGASVDRTHPRTADRLRLQESLPPASAQLVMDLPRRTAIDAELAPLLDAALKRMADHYRYVS